MARRLQFDEQDKRALQALDRDFTISTDGETATVVGEMEIEIVRPADDAGARFWLTIRFPGGETLDVRIGRTQLLEPRWPCDLVRLARHRGAPLGYRLHRSRKPKGPGNAGEFMLIHKASSTVALGAGYAATIEAVLDFIERERLGQARANQNAAGRRDPGNDQAT